VSKKKFSSGLDSLFDNSEEQNELVQTSARDSSATVFEESNTKPAQAINRRITSKNFTSDLDSLFQDAFTEAVEEKVEKMRRTVGIDDPFENNRRQYKQPLSGLDALIRSTVDTSLAGLDHAAIKRLTIMFETQKIEKLKSIAKMERAFVKDIVSGILSEFIEDYEKKNGKSL
jgi:16S rRNA G966 N2-methylase RsmD